MLRGEQILCGTSTTGVTSPLALAAIPTGVGGLDPYTAFSGLGLGTTNKTPLPYILIEYTDSTYTQPKQMEKGLGYLLIGANLAGSTIDRLALVTETGMNTTTPTQTYGTPQSGATNITIGTAANCLIFIGPSAWDLPAGLQAYATSGVSGSDALGVSPVMTPGSGNTLSLTSGTVYYWAIKLDHADVIKSCSFRLTTAVSSPTSSSCNVALYAVGKDGLPGKKLIDFGGVAGTNPLGTANATLTATAAAGVPIMPGYYYLAILPIWSGGSGSPAVRTGIGAITSPLGTGFAGINGPICLATVASQAALNDPATVTSLTATATPADSQLACAFRNS